MGLIVTPNPQKRRVYPERRISTEKLTLGIILIMILTLAVPGLYACELCGCNSGTYFIGPFPQFNSYFMGMQYSFQNYETILDTDPGQFSRDYYRTVQIMGGTVIENKWQIMAFLHS